MWPEPHYEFQPIVTLNFTFLLTLISCSRKRLSAITLRASSRQAHRQHDAEHSVEHCAALSTWRDAQPENLRKIYRMTSHCSYYRTQTFTFQWENLGHLHLFWSHIHLCLGILSFTTDRKKHREQHSHKTPLILLWCKALCNLDLESKVLYK